MKRFAVFSFVTYEASGGWNDLQGLYDTLEEAKVPVWGFGASLGSFYDRAHIVDLEAGKVVSYWDNDAQEWKTE